MCSGSMCYAHARRMWCSDSLNDGVDRILLEISRYLRQRHPPVAILSRVSFHGHLLESGAWSRFVNGVKPDFRGRRHIHPQLIC